MSAVATDLRPCKGCGRPLSPPDRWCSDACFRDTEGPEPVEGES